MLIDDLFTVNKIGSGHDLVQAAIVLKKEHPIFAGHFPGNPVLPGVCMIQMVKEILEKQMGMALRLSTSDSIKFLSVIDPVASSRLNVSVNYHSTGEGYQVKAALTDSTATYFKFSGTFTSVI